MLRTDLASMHRLSDPTTPRHFDSSLVDVIRATCPISAISHQPGSDTGAADLSSVLMDGNIEIRRGDLLDKRRIWASERKSFRRLWPKGPKQRKRSCKCASRVPQGDGSMTSSFFRLISENDVLLDVQVA